MYKKREDLRLNAEKEMIDLIDQNLQQFDSNTQTAESVYSMRELLGNKFPSF